MLYTTLDYVLDRSHIYHVHHILHDPELKLLEPSLSMDESVHDGDVCIT